MNAVTLERDESTQRAVSKQVSKSRRAKAFRVVETQVAPPPAPTSIPQDVEAARAVERACADLQWLVIREARRVARRVPYFTELDDLIGAGAIGLVTAVQRHIDREMPILQRFAQLRIRGAILDHLRTNDHLTRRQRAAVGQLRKQTERLQREGKSIDTEALAQAMSMGRARVERIQHQLAAVHVTHIEDGERLPASDSDPTALTMRNELQQHVTAALATLPEKTQTLLSLYYYEGLSYREIGTVLGVTDSRICQLHTQAMQTLRRRLAHLR